MLASINREIRNIDNDTLQTVAILNVKHKDTERALEKLIGKVAENDKEAQRLCNIHTDQSDQILEWQSKIATYWRSLNVKAKELNEAYFFHRFLDDFKTMVSWIRELKATIEADEFVEVFGGVEAHFERHKEHKREIDAREEASS